jgi:hypothetical protein
MLTILHKPLRARARVGQPDRLFQATLCTGSQPRCALLLRCKVVLSVRQRRFPFGARIVFA